MKNLVLLFSIILSFSSCSQSDEKKINDNSIIGTWKLIEKIGSGDDGFPIWKPVDETEVYFYTFLENGIIINSRNENDCNGVYKLNSTKTTINIVYDCNNSLTEGNFNFTFENNNLVLSPKPDLCDEGCSQKFKRVK